jgi:hypothetical protein
MSRCCDNNSVSFFTSLSTSFPYQLQKDEGPASPPTGAVAPAAAETYGRRGPAPASPPAAAAAGAGPPAGRCSRRTSVSEWVQRSWTLQ